LDSPDTGYFGDGDERRPSVASVTTASSSGSKSSSMLRSGAHTYKKLQGFFGEEAPGKDEPPSSEPPGRGQRSNSYTRFHRDRDRNNSISTEVRDASPVPSRPRTPVPSADVVPFLYQDLEVSHPICNLRL
jgi:adenylate cyclase